MGLQQRFGLDSKDMQIISMLIKNPEISQQVIAKQIKVSQPSVNLRLHKLKKNGLLSSSIGVDVNKTGMHLARVDFTAQNADEVLNNLQGCPFFVNGFVLSGKHNGSMLVVSDNLKKIDAIINKHLRSNPEIKDINVSVIVNSTKPIVCALNFSCEKAGCKNEQSCQKCSIR